jgi:hypothetical protein
MYRKILGERSFEKDMERQIVGMTASPSYINAAFIHRLQFSVSATGTDVILNKAIPDVDDDDIWLVIDAFTNECEIRKATTVNNTQYTIAALAYDHAIDDLVLWVTEPIANVKWFGAKGDDTTNDYTSIQRAIDQAEASEFDTVLIPPGDYKINSGLVIDDPCKLMGVGSASTLASTSNITLITMESDSEVHDLRLVGNVRTNSASRGIVIGGNAAVSTNVQAVIKNVKFSTGFYYGIYSDFEIDRALIENVTMTSIITKGGIYLDWDGVTGAKSANVTIRRCALSPTIAIVGEENFGIYARGFDVLLLEQNTVNDWDKNVYISGTSSKGIWGLRILGLHTEERRTGIYNGDRWSAALGVSADDIILPTKANATGFVYKAQGNGTTGGTEPTWPTAYAGTVVDNTVTWEAVATSVGIYVGAYLREGAISDVYSIDHIYGIVDNSTARLDAHDLHVTGNDFSFIRQSGGPSYWSIRGSAFDGNYQAYISSFGSATDSMITFENTTWANNNLGHTPSQDEMLIQQSKLSVGGKSVLNHGDMGSPGTGASSGGQLFAAGDVRTEGGLSVGSSSNNAAAGAIWATDDIYNVVWTDYSGTSTVTGWTSFTTKVIDYKKVGNLVFVKFRLIGTSNTTGANFTLPLTAEGDTNGACWGRDNTGTRAPTLFFVDGSIPDVDIWWGGSATGWTNSGTKEAAGQFFYEIA